MVTVQLSDLSTIQKFKLLRMQLNKVALERESVVDVMLAALITGLPVCLHGKPGTGKTMLAELIALAIRGKYAYILNNPSMKPGELYGVPNVEKLKTDSELVYNTKNKAPSANIIVSDEIGKAPSWAMNAQLRMMNEKRGPNNEKLDVVGYYFATNESFASQSPAFADRMACNVMLQNVRDWDNRIALKERELKIRETPQVTKGLLTVEEVKGLWEVVQGSVDARPVLGVLNAIEDKLRDKNEKWEISTRKSAWILRFLQALAWVRGESQVSHSLVVEFVPNAVWQDPKEIQEVTAVVRDTVNEINSQIIAQEALIKKEWTRFEGNGAWTEDRVLDILSQLEESIKFADVFKKQGASVELCEGLKDWCDRRILEVRTQMDGKQSEQVQQEIRVLRAMGISTARQVIHESHTLGLDKWNDLAGRAVSEIDEKIDRLDEIGGNDANKASEDLTMLVAAIKREGLKKNGLEVK